MSRNPFYIWAPSWTMKSSGTRVLHMLCSRLRGVGEAAYICPAGWGDEYALNPLLDAPVLTGNVAAFYKDAGVGAIAVYPDIVRGNPFGCDRVVRYLLAPPGAYGGDAVEAFGAGDKVWSYRKDIAALVGSRSSGVLCLPTFDKTVFYEPKPNSDGTPAKRYGSCFYSWKYDKIHGNKLLEKTSRSVRLEGSWAQIAEVLRGSTVCYVYEMTEIIVLAALCGCPVEFVKTGYFDGVDLDSWQFALGDGESMAEAVDRWEEEFAVGLLEFVRQRWE